MAEPTETLDLAQNYHRRGQWAEAELLYARILAGDPRNALALQALGMLALQQGRVPDALQRAATWIELQPLEAAAHALMGMAQLAAGRREEALLELKRAIELDPHNGKVLHPRGEALLARPDDTGLKLALGRALLRLGRGAEALACFDAACALEPGNLDAHNGRGAALRYLRRMEPALESFAVALKQNPHNAAIINNYALTLHDLNRSAEAIDCLHRALALRPDYAAALHNLGMILHSIDRHAESAQVYSRLIATGDVDYAAGHLMRARLACCDWRQYDEDRERVLSALASGAPAAADPLTALMLTDAAEVQLDCARRYAARHYPASGPPLWSGERYRHGRMRIAYLSADFHDHPVSHLLVGVLERHDRRRFETIGVSLRQEVRTDPTHARIRRAFEHFLDVEDLGDRDVAAQLRELEVDIAVDLSGPTRGGRLAILAARPAPLQVNYLGFAGTYGANYIDYLIADAATIPPENDRFYAERIVRLPLSFLPNDDQQAIANETPRRCDEGLPEAAFVFCAFSNAYKITPALFDVWMWLLRETPASVLWLRAGTSAAVANLRREAAARGVAAERLVFAARVPSLERHLARYRLADLFLDTVPYGAHATARDALWAGLPVLTCVGQAFASRVASSLLAALDLEELVTDNLTAYGSLATALARSAVRMADLRRRLAQHRSIGSAFDTDRHRRHLESAYQMIWRRHESGEPAASVEVAN